MLIYIIPSETLDSDLHSKNCVVMSDACNSLAQHRRSLFLEQINSPRSTDEASLIAQLVKNPPAMQETPVRFLGREDPLEKGKATLPTPVFWPGEFLVLYSPWGSQ